MIKVTFKEKVGYALGDFATSMFWKLFSMFLMIYYTDIVELSPAAVGTMFFITRLWDGVNDPIMGAIADRTKSKYGKFRPYLLWGAIPFAIIGVLTFSNFDFSPSGKLVYAYVSYTLMMMAYTFVNVPYASLLGVMTNDSNEKTSLASVRFVGAFAGGIFMTATIPYFLDLFNKSHTWNNGYQAAAMIYASIAACCFVVCFLWTKERLKPLPTVSTIKEDFKDLAQNNQWFVMLGACVAFLIFTSLHDGIMMYYFKYYVQNQSLYYFGDVTWQEIAGAFITVWLMANLVGVLLVKPISKRMGKKQTFLLAIILCVVFSLCFYLFKPSDVWLMFLNNIIIGIASGVVAPLFWSMYGDITDYSEWKTGRRATGLVFSSSSMSQKIGWTIGGAAAGWLLAAYGFEANVEQSEASLKGVKLMMSVYPAIGALISAVFIMRYTLDDDVMEKIQKELYIQRNKKAQ